MRRKMLLASSLVIAFSTAATAQVTSRDAAKIQAGSYAVEPYHTRVLFAVSHLGFTTYYGEFTKTAGALMLNPADPGASKLDITIATSSVSTTNATLNEELKSSDWFDVQKFPSITFKSGNVKVTGKDTARVSGDLTLHGVTKPVTLSVKFNGGGMNPLDKHYTVGFEVSGVLKRSDFGVSKYVPLVGDEVELIISAGFEHQG